MDQTYQAIGISAAWQTWASSGLLTLITVPLFFRIGYAVDKERARAWAALTVLMLGWSLNMLVLGRETAVTYFLFAVTFFIITIHRYRMISPRGRAARFACKIPFVPKLPDAG